MTAAVLPAVALLHAVSVPPDLALLGLLWGVTLALRWLEEPLDVRPR